MRGFDLPLEKQESAREYVEDQWATIQAAVDAGWVDPGYTEALDVTVSRAREYLQKRTDSKPSGDDRG